VTPLGGRAIYALLALALLAVEILIALFVRDAFVRPYVGDMLAVALVYAVLRAMTPMRLAWALAATLVIAFAVEFAQLFGLLGVLGLVDNQLARTVLGGVFDPMDLAAYASGGLLILLVEMGLRRGR
jgi:Protein of unknown function (DUF2809)